MAHFTVVKPFLDFLVTPVILLILHPQIHNKHPHSRQLELAGW